GNGAADIFFDPDSAESGCALRLARPVEVAQKNKTARGAWLGGRSFLGKLQAPLLKQIGGGAGEEFFHVGGGGFALHEGGVAHDRLLQGDGGFDAADEVFAERAV